MSNNEESPENKSTSNPFRKLFFTNLNSEEDIKRPQNKKFTCTCNKSKCIKKYCICFQNGEECDGCKCLKCENKKKNLKFQSPIKDEENTAPSVSFCNCTKSNCMKSYCECFKSKKTCNNLCRCLNCNNVLFKPVNAVIRITPKDYKMERISVYLKKNKLVIEKIDLEEDPPNRNKVKKDIFSIESDVVLLPSTDKKNNLNNIDLSVQSNFKVRKKIDRSPVFTTCERTTNKKTIRREIDLKSDAKKVIKKLGMDMYTDQSIFK